MMSWAKVERYITLAGFLSSRPDRVYDRQETAKVLQRWLDEHQPIIDEHGVDADTVEIADACEKVRNAIRLCCERSGVA